MYRFICLYNDKESLLFKKKLGLVTQKHCYLFLKIKRNSNLLKYWCLISTNLWLHFSPPISTNSCEEFFSWSYDLQNNNKYFFKNFKFDQNKLFMDEHVKLFRRLKIDIHMDFAF